MIAGRRSAASELEPPAVEQPAESSAGAPPQLGPDQPSAHSAAIAGAISADRDHCGTSVTPGSVPSSA